MSHDVWQYAIVIFVCLTGCLPWQKAAGDDPRYVRYCHWHGSNGVMMQVSFDSKIADATSTWNPFNLLFRLFCFKVRRPKMFKALSSRAQRMFRKYLEPRPTKRPQGLAEASRYLEDRWLTKSTADRNNSGKIDRCVNLQGL